MAESPTTTARSGAPDDHVVRARNAVFLVFTLAGVTFASWASRIADSKELLGLGAGELGVTLLFASLGSVIGLPLAGKVADRVGAATAVRIGATIGGVGLAGISFGVDGPHSRWGLAVGLFFVGLGVGLWDVSMNLEGASVERLLGRSVMPHFHAAFSGGTVVAALLGAGAVALGVPLWLHMLVAGGLAAGATIWGAGRFLPRAEEDHESGQVAPEGAGAGRPRSAWLEPRTLAIGVVVFAAAFTEGTANDWMAVAFREGHHLPNWAGVLGFATFLVFMTAGRLVGTRMLDTYGRVPVLRVTFLLAVIGTVLVVFGSPVLAYAGAAVWGVGASLGFPVGMSASADDPTRANARMSVVATIGYVAFIAGPPLLGFLGDHWGVLRSLLAVGGLLAIAILTVTATREPQPPGAPTDAAREAAPA